MDLLPIKTLKDKKFRITKIRKGVIKLLNSSRTPISATKILNSLYMLDLNANKTTIYRELDFLKNQGIVREIEFGDGKKRYELETGAHHHHIVCVNCEYIADIDFDVDLAQHENQIAKQTGFKIKEHSIEFFGYCRKCQS